MPDIFSALDAIASARRVDPLAPVTVITPSHAAALQLRRRLAELVAFAAVRFETLPRIAELLGAGHLAAAGRAPLARPIGDYVAERVARESRGALAGVGDLPGYARVLRQIFRRLRRGGIRSAAEAAGGPFAGHMDEVLRLYDRYRAETAQFYDEEDLLEAAAAALRSGRAGALADLGAVYVAPPCGESAAGEIFLAALQEAAPACVRLDEPVAEPEMRFVLAPDPASEAREVVREVLQALEAGVPLHEVAVFHGADPAYRRLLREECEAAGVPAVPLPGVPLSETATGRGVLALARLPERDFSRTAVMDVLGVAPLREWLPGGGRQVRAMGTLWDKLSREAGVTHGETAWSTRLGAMIEDREAALAGYDGESETRARMAAYERDGTRDLRDVIGTLVARLKPVCDPQPAEGFIETFKGIVREYVAPEAAALADVEQEIEQLGTVGAVGGSFSLAGFAQALGANLEAAFLRPRRLGDGVAIAEYRAAPGLRFRHVVLCGTYEGVFPAGPGTEALVPDRTWETLRRQHPQIEDAALRIERAQEAARRVLACAGGGTLVWTAPLYEPGGTRDYYPSPLMVEAVSRRGGSAITASGLRAHPPADGWLRRSSSPLAALLHGPVVEPGELLVRRAIALRRRGGDIGPEHPRSRAVAMLRGRRQSGFTEWDGNLAALREPAWLDLQQAVSPTSLENYAACGFKYLCRSLLRLNAVEEPGEQELMDAAARGDLVHRVLQRFFAEQKANGRPAVGEAWSDDDLALLMRYIEEALAEAARRGLTGLDVYSAHETRTMRADLRRFLEEDTAFRRGTGAVPTDFEARIPDVEIAGVRLRGVVDRVDRTPDGRRAWVIDYKTGSARNFDEMTADDPLAGGRKLQLPAYLATAGEAAEKRALYWFISQKGGFEKLEYEPSPENQGRFEATLAAIVRGIRAGAFPAVPGEEDEFYGAYANCRYCDFDRICSRRRDFEHDAKAGDAAMGPWLAVGQAASGGGRE